MAHGKKSRLLVDGYTMTNIARGVSVSAIKEIADSTVIEVNDHESEAGQKGGRVSVQALYKGSQSNVELAVNESIASDDTHTVAYAPEGFEVGNAVIFGESHENQASVVGDNKSVVSLSIGYEVTGGLAAGLSLFNPYES